MSNDRKTTTRTGRRTGRTNYLPWLKLLIRLLIIGVTALVVILLVNNWRKIAPLSFIDWYDQVSGTVEKGQEYPYTLDGNAVIDMAEVSPHLVVLDESSIRFFTEDAACVVERSHPFADPTLHTAGPYALLTEVGGSRIQLETRRETVLRTEIKNRKIYAGDLAADGTMAFVLNSSSQSYLSEIRVLNAKGESLFEYQSSKYLLNDIALSPDRKKVAVTGTTAEDGLLKSVVLIAGAFAHGVVSVRQCDLGCRGPRSMDTDREGRQSVQDFLRWSGTDRLHGDLVDGVRRIKTRRCHRRRYGVAV